MHADFEGSELSSALRNDRLVLSMYTCLLDCCVLKTRKKGGGGGGLATAMTLATRVWRICAFNTVDWRTPTEGCRLCCSTTVAAFSRHQLAINRDVTYRALNWVKICGNLSCLRQSGVEQKCNSTKTEALNESEDKTHNHNSEDDTRCTAGDDWPALSEKKGAQKGK